MMRPTRIRHSLALLSIAVLQLASAPSAQAEATAHIEGSLREKGTRKPLQDANIFLLPDPEAHEPSTAGFAPFTWSSPTPQESPGATPPAPPAPARKPLKATTDARGHFSIEGAPVGPFKWIVNVTGYDRLEKTDVLTEDPNPSRDLYLEKSSYLGAYETTIYDKAVKRDDKTRSVRGDDLSKLAGSSNDPIKAVQNLPGVNRPSGFSSQVVIEGSSPNDTVYEIEGQQVPLIFHFGAFTTVVPPESVDRVDLLTSGFGVEYGRSTAGLVSVWLKNPRTDRLHGEAYMDIFNVGAMLEGPIGEHSSFFLGLRQSYIGLVLKAALAGNSDFDLTVAPDFGDLTGIFQTEVTPIDNFRLVEVASLDTLNFIFKEPVSTEPALRGTFSEQTSFFRLIPEWTHRHSSRTISKLSFGFGRDWFRIDTGDNYLHISDWSLTARYDLEREFSPYWKAAWGLDNAFYWSQVALQLPKLYGAGGVFTPFSVGQVITVGVKQDYAALGAYWRNEIHLGDTPWTLLPSLRVESYNITGEVIPEPRLQVRYKLSDSLTLRSASGLYGMPPQPQETSPVYGNPDLRMPLSVHFTAGAETDFRHGASNGWELNGDFFYKHFYRLITPSAAYVTQSDGTLSPENYNNDGHGRAFGLEAQAKYTYGPVSGWLTYTLSRSTRWNPSAPEAVSRYDQTHNLAALASVQLGGNWQISSRFRLVTGNPYTPISGGVLDTDNDVYVPIPGAYYSQRFEPFWQLDLRVDKKWVYDSWILSAYLDIQNVTNHANNEALRYSYDYASTVPVQDLPIIPIVGMKGEF